MPGDEQLMRELAAGDRRALAVLYERYSERVFRTAFRYLHDEEEARDIAQSVFVTLAQSARRYRPEARLSTWIYRVVANRCLNHRARAENRLREHDAMDALEQAPAPREMRPDRLLQAAEEGERLRAALRRLPPRQRMALVLRHFEGLSYDEIALALGFSRNSLESLLFRARRSLRQYF